MPTPNFKKESFAEDKAKHEKDFPEYEYLGPLGESNAIVFKGRHRKTGEIVAIKYFPKKINEGNLRRFKREAKIMSGLSHKHIVKVKSSHLEASLPYIVIEWVEGGDVRGLLGKDKFGKDKSLDILTTIHLGLQMNDALREIHKNDIYHSDIKPENILFRDISVSERRFLLTDFGISRLKGSQKSTSLGMATLEYCAPERFYNDDDPNDGDPTEATDFYSLGVVLYECLSGNLPYLQGSKSDNAFMRIVRHSLIPPLTLPDEHLQKELPQSLNDLIIKLLSKEPGERLKNIDVHNELKKAEFDFLRSRARENIFKAIHLPDMVGISCAVNIPPISFPTRSFPQSPQFKYTPVDIPVLRIQPRVLKRWENWPGLSDLDPDYRERIKDNLEWVNSSLKKDDRISSEEYMKFYFYRWILFLQRSFSNFLKNIS